MYDTITLINNDKYGATELKKLHQGYTLKGFIVAVTIHIALIAAYMLIAYINQSKAKDIPFNPRTPIILADYDLTPPSINEAEIPPVKEEEVIQNVKDLSSLVPQHVKKQDADDVVLKTQDELNNINTQTSRTGDTIIIAGKDINIDDTKIKDVINDNTGDNTKTTFNISEVDVVPECINLPSVKSDMK